MQIAAHRAPLLLARFQFAANITHHILFPTFNIALGWALLHFKLRHNRWARSHGFPSTASTPRLLACRFWVKVFALTFALGVVSRITLSFQFGTHCPGFMQTVGNHAVFAGGIALSPHAAARRCDLRIVDESRPRAVRIQGQLTAT